MSKSEMKNVIMIMAMITFVFATNSRIAQAATRCVDECINKQCKIKFNFPIEYAQCVDVCKTLCHNVNIGMPILSLFYYIYWLISNLSYYKY